MARRARPAQQTLITLLTEHADVDLVPVTGRSRQALERVSLQVQGKFTSDKVLLHGCLILDRNNRADPTWTKRTKAHLSPLQEVFYKLHDFTKVYTNWTVRMEKHGDLITAVHIRQHPPGNLNPPAPWGEELDDFQARVDEEAQHLPVKLLRSATALSVLSSEHGKKAAVLYLKEKRPESVLSIGIGDNLSDFGMLSVCDFAMQPTQSDLFKHLKLT